MMPILPNSQVYFARCYTHGGIDMETMKIGCAVDIAKREESLRAGLPFECRMMASVPGGMVLEHFLHCWFRADRIRGEFFRPSAEIMEAVASIQRRGRLPMKIPTSAEGMDWSRLDLPQFMRAHQITDRDIKRECGITVGYEKLLQTNPSGNRRVVAALMVTAIRKGVKFSWPRDFLPSREASAA